jgi:hypothetical protein
MMGGALSSHMLVAVFPRIPISGQYPGIAIWPQRRDTGTLGRITVTDFENTPKFAPI